MLFLETNMSWLLGLPITHSMNLFYMSPSRPGVLLATLAVVAGATPFAPCRSPRARRAVFGPPRFCNRVAGDMFFTPTARAVPFGVLRTVIRGPALKIEVSRKPGAKGSFVGGLSDSLVGLTPPGAISSTTGINR